MQEMDETETERAVIMGRKADDYGSVDNDEIDELARLSGPLYPPSQASTRTFPDR